MMRAHTKGTGRLQELLQPTGEEDLLAVNFPQPRVRVPTLPALVISVFVVALVSYLAWRAHTYEPTVKVDNLAQTVDMSDPAQPESGEVVVSIVGAVDSPGLVSLPAGSRIAHALERAHPQPDADLVSLNLAQKLTDGQQIYVPRQGEAPPMSSSNTGAGGADATAGGAGATVALNTATAEQLTSLEGVGEVTAKAIIKYRDSHGGFSSVEELQEVTGIGPSKFAHIKPQVSL